MLLYNEHNKELRELADVLEVERKGKRPSYSKQRQTQFVKQDEYTADTRGASRTS